MTHVIDFVIEPRRDGCMAIIYVDKCIVAKQRFTDWDEARLWCERQVAARKQAA